MTTDKKYIYGLQHLLNEKIDANNFYTTSIWVDFTNFNKNIWPAIKCGRWIERWAVLLLCLIFVKAAPMDFPIFLKGVFGLWMTYISFLAIILGSSIAFFLSRLIFIRKYKPLGVKDESFYYSAPYYDLPKLQTHWLIKLIGFLTGWIIFIIGILLALKFIG